MRTISGVLDAYGNITCGMDDWLDEEWELSLVMFGLRPQLGGTILLNFCEVQFCKTKLWTNET